MSIRSMLRNSATIQTPTTAATTYSDAGTKTWANLYVGIDADIQPVTSHETTMFGGEQSVVTHIMYCVPADVPAIAAKDKVLFDSREFEIVGVQNTDHVNRLMRIGLVETKGRTVD